MARVLMSIVIVFLICHSPKIVVNFYEALQVLMLIFCDQLIGVFFLRDAPTFAAKLIDVVIDTLQLAERGVLLKTVIDHLSDGSARGTARAPRLADDDRQSEPPSPHNQLRCQYSHLFLQGPCSNAILISLLQIDERMKQRQNIGSTRHTNYFKS